MAQVSQQLLTRQTMADDCHCANKVHSLLLILTVGAATSCNWRFPPILSHAHLHSCPCLGCINVCVCTPVAVRSAVIQLLFFPLGSQAALPWADMPLMKDGVYLPLLTVAFIPGASINVTGDSTVSYSALNLCVFAIIWSIMLVSLSVRLSHQPALACGQRSQ